MNTADAAVVFSDQRLVAAYEELRAQAVAHDHGGPGLAIMVMRGFRCWLECCTRLLGPAPARTELRQRSESHIPADLRGEVIVLVASILLHRASRGMA